ncbi:MAG: ABC transporter ATP-binding protein/permease [Oscillospiraceae bacterium]|nr:ABC transporter ATP-binding protein/permease [Oscillospiraceae bacterium]
MLKLLKYLKPFTVMVIFIFIFAFFQAMADLNLPNIMSDIVNYGIQRNGIVNAVPDALRKTEYDKLSIFLTDDNKKIVDANYLLIDKSSQDYDKYVKTYPDLANEPIYVLNTTDKDTINTLDPIMAKAIMSVSGVDKLMQENNNDVQKVLQSFMNKSSDNSSQAPSPQMQAMLSKIDPNADIFTVIAQIMKAMPADQIQKMRDTVDQQMAGIPESLLSQATSPYIKNEYSALGIDTSKYQQNYIIRAGGFMLLIAIGSMTCTLIVSFLSSKTAMGFGRDVGRKLFSHVETFSLGEFDRVGTASLITRNTNDITQVQMVVMMFFRMMITAPMMAVGGIIMAVSKARSLSWLIIVIVPILLVIIVTFASVAIPYFQKMQKFLDKINQVLREKLIGIRVIRAFNRDEYEAERFNKANTDYFKNALKIFRIMAFVGPIMLIAMNVTPLSIIWTGAHAIDAGTIQIGDMMAFVQYMIQIMMSFMMLTMMFIMVPRAQVSATRINEVLAIEPKIEDKDNVLKLPETKNENVTLEFKDVVFSYPGAEKPALKNISFKAKSGETTAIIGSTGSGKTTLVNLIPRFYDIQSGSIDIDGINIKDISQEDLRNEIGFVPQKAMLFSGSISENIRYGKENASDEEVKESAEIAQAMDFIDEKEDKFNDYISQGGTNISGGQKQRLSIARALVRRPDIYIFDDSFSALDFKTDAKLRAALKDKVKDAILVIVAQRVSTVMDADRIIVLEDGEMVGIGTHKELIKNCPTYKELVLSQLSEEEIA